MISNDQSCSTRTGFAASYPVISQQSQSCLNMVTEHTIYSRHVRLISPISTSWCFPIPSATQCYLILVHSITWIVQKWSFGVPYTVIWNILKLSTTAIVFLDLVFLFTISYSNKIKILFHRLKMKCVFERVNWYAKQLQIHT